MQVTPSIIGKNFFDVKGKISLVEGLVDWVQLDVADGIFAESDTWSAPEDLLEVEGKTKIEAHLMIEKPEEVLTEWVNYVDRVIIHLESTEHLAEIVDVFEHHKTVELGLALLLNTPVEKIEPYIDKIKLVQLMSINKIGFHGQPFNLLVIDKVKELRSQYPNLKIQIDGGIGLPEAKLLKEAGADAVVVGSQIWNNDIASTIKEFEVI
jgi:ribulose-phosphate 3-epimerase